MQTYYHTRHVCGHSVYWSDPTIGRLLSSYPCPHCGGESGDPPPADANLLDLSGVICFRALNPDGSVPAPGRLGEQVGIQHMTGNVCCD